MYEKYPCTYQFLKFRRKIAKLAVFLFNYTYLISIQNIHEKI